MAFHPCNSAHHRGPLIIIGVGIGFALVGAIPVAVNVSRSETNSGTIIGVGFIGFGLLLVIPGILWCVYQRLMGLRRVCDCCGSWHSESGKDIQETTPALETRRESRSSSTADDGSITISAHNDCTFDDEDERSGTAVIVIPPPQRTESTR